MRLPGHGSERQRAVQAFSGLDPGLGLSSESVPRGCFGVEIEGGGKRGRREKEINLAMLMKRFALTSKTVCEE